MKGKFIGEDKYQFIIRITTSSTTRRKVKRKIVISINRIEKLIMLLKRSLIVFNNKRNSSI